MTLTEPLTVCIPCKDRSLVYEGGKCLMLLPNALHHLRWGVWQKGEPVRVLIADFGSTDWPLDQWVADVLHPIPVRIIQIKGPFSVGRAWNVLAREAANEWLFFLDTDMIVDRQTFERGVAAIQQGKAYFPICFSYSDPEHARGYWRPSGCGNAFLTKTDYWQYGPRPEFTTHGKSDEHFLASFKAAGKAVRQREPGFVHQWHPNTLPWLNRFYAEQHTEESVARKNIWLASKAAVPADADPLPVLKVDKDAAWLKILCRPPPDKPTGVSQYWTRLRGCLRQAGIACDILPIEKWLAGDWRRNAKRDVLISTAEDARLIPPEYRVIAVQHGCAGEHQRRVPSWHHEDMVEDQRQSARRPNTLWVADSRWAAMYNKEHMGVAADRIIYGCVDTDIFAPGERQRLRNAAKPVVLHRCTDANKGGHLVGAVAAELGDAFEVRPLNAPPSKVPDAMRAADVWLSLSASEGLPMVVQEALSCGLIVVGTDVGVLWPYAQEGPAVPARRGGLHGCASAEIGSIIFDWRLRDSAAFVADMVRSAWESRAHLSGRDYARQWWGVRMFTQKWLEAIQLLFARFGSAPQPTAAKPSRHVVIGPAGPVRSTPPGQPQLAPYSQAQAERPRRALGGRMPGQ